MCHRWLSIAAQYKQQLSIQLIPCCALLPGSMLHIICLDNSKGFDVLPKLAFGNPTIRCINMSKSTDPSTNSIFALVSPLLERSACGFQRPSAFGAWQVHVGAKGEWTPTFLWRSRSDCSRTAFSSQDVQTNVGRSSLKQTPPFQTGSGTNRMPFQDGPQGNGPGFQQTRTQYIQGAALVRQWLASLLQQPKRRRHLTTGLSSPCAEPMAWNRHTIRPNNEHMDIACFNFKAS